jgi:phosphogluconate dehydratase
MTLLKGNLGRGILKISAVKTENHIIEAPAVVFYNQNDVLRAFKNGLLQKDIVVVLKNQGPAANGMPELHKLTPALGSLQDQGFRVALVTDGRMSGASGKVPAAIHVSPECMLGGDLDLVQDGDMIRVDGVHGHLVALVDATEWNNRKLMHKQKNINFDFGSGREMFFSVRQHVTSAEEGASFLFLSEKKGESCV